VLLTVCLRLTIQVVVLTNATIAKQIEIDDFCRSKGIYFIAADVRGLFGLVILFHVYCLADEPVPFSTISARTLLVLTQPERILNQG
jgi:molybdopterin/thiamine biosynthesis adenylyltransferase